MADHSDLIERARAWGESKARGLDVGLLEQVLHLHVNHGGLAAGDWPEGCVGHLLMETWSEYGGVLPDMEELAATMDTYWRFLRATGQMTYGSAPGKVLLGDLWWAMAFMEEVVPTVDPADVAADVRRGAFVRRCLALAPGRGSGAGASRPRGC